LPPIRTMKRRHKEARDNPQTCEACLRHRIVCVSGQQSMNQGARRKMDDVRLPGHVVVSEYSHLYSNRVSQGITTHVNRTTGMIVDSACSNSTGSRNGRKM